MYNKEQLDGMTLSELKKIAKEMGIKGADKAKQDDLTFKILDEQAVSAAQNTETTPSRKRARVSVKNVDKVYSANQTKAKKVDKTMKVTKDDSLFAELSDEAKALVDDSIKSKMKANKDNTEELVLTSEVPAPKKRGRKSAAEKKAEEEAKAAANTVATDTE